MMKSLPLESPSGGESSEGRDITSYSYTKNQKVSTYYTGIGAI